MEPEKKNLKFPFKKPKIPLPKIKVDQLKVRQVILNLVDKAIKYTLRGEIEIKTEKINSNIRSSLRDTGEGLSKEEKGKIFKVLPEEQPESLTGFKIKLAKKEKPDLILLDILLPDENRINFLAELKKEPEISQIPVVAISNYDEPETKMEVFKLGVKEY